MFKFTKIFGQGKIRPERPVSVVEDRIWRRIEDPKKGAELARKVWPRELKGRTTKPMAIEEGTVGLFFSNGALVGTLQPGRHDLGGALKKWGILDFDLVEYVVCMEQADFYLEFGYENLDTFKDKSAVSTQDPMLLADIDARLFFNISDPPTFFKQVMRGKEVVYAEDVAELLDKEVADVCRDLMHKTNYSDALRNLDTKHNLERQLISELKTHLAHLGITLVQASSFSFYSKQWAEMQEDNRKAAALAYQVEVIARQRKIEYADQIAQLRDKLESGADQRKLEFGDEAAFLKDKDEVDKFKEKLLQDKYLRKEDILELEHMLTMKKEGRDNELAKLKLTNERDLIELQLQTDKSLKDAKLKTMVEHTFQEHKRLEELEDKVLANKIALASADTDVEIAKHDAEEMKLLLEIKKIKDQQKHENDKFDLDLKKDLMQLVHGQNMDITKLEADTKVRIAEIEAGRDTAVAKDVIAEKDRRISDIKDTQAQFARFVELGITASMQRPDVVVSNPAFGGFGMVGGTQTTSGGMEEVVCPGCGHVHKFSSGKTVNFCSSCGKKLS